MKHFAKIHVEEKEAKLIRKLLATEPQNEDGCFGEDELIVNSVIFDNGMSADIKLCGVQYEEGSCNTPWTEMVLFAPHNGFFEEVACSEVEDTYFGTWSMEYNGESYEIEVI